VVHPQSIVHSMVEYVTVGLAQLGCRHCGADLYALTYPERRHAAAGSISRGRGS